MSDPLGHSTLVVIPACSVAHVHGDNQRHLADGHLTLYSTTNDKNPLVLSVGPAAFPLSSTTPFGTLHEDTATYVFQPKSVPGHVLLRLPHTVVNEDSHLATLQETFEAVLIKHGLLKDGIDAYADEIARSSQESALALAARIRQGTAAYLASKPPTAYPVQVDRSVHEAVDRAAAHTRSAASSTRRVANNVGSHASNAGAWLAKQSGSPVAPQTEAAFAPTDLPFSENDEAVSAQSLSSIASTYVTTASSLSSSMGALAMAVGESISAFVGHEFGPDAQRVADGTGASLLGANNAVGNIGNAVNPTWLGKRGVLGALDVKDPERAEEVRQEGEDIQAKGAEIGVRK